MTYYKRIALGAIIAGLSLNEFCTKQRAFKGALRSLFFKLWYRLKKSVVKINTIVVKAAKISGCVEIVSNSTTSSARVLKVGSIVHSSHIEAFKSIYKFEMVIL